MKKYTILIVAALFANTIANAQRITVSIAGTGVLGSTGDWNDAKFAKVSRPNDICMDAQQNIYFVEQYSGRVRKISPKGTITTIAGGGTSFADGVAATSDTLSPNYMCLDSVGNMFITSINQIRRIDATTGIITTIAGDTAVGFAGDGGPASAARFNTPQGICMDRAGNLYVADALNNRLRKITAATGTITTIAGSGIASYGGDGGTPATMAQLHYPVAVAIMNTGDILFSDQYGMRVRRISAATGGIYLYAGNGGSIAAAAGGPAVTTAVGEVGGIAVDSSNNVYLCDNSCSLTEVVNSTGIIYLIGGTLATDSYNGDGMNSIGEEFNNPNGIWRDHLGNIYVADALNNRIRKVILLRHTPTFAYGNGESFNVCPGYYIHLDSLLAITDLDSAQTETWSIITPPGFGSVYGFPASASSFGTYSTASPAGASYMPLGSYAGLDSFKVQVSDGVLSDTMTIYISVGAASISGANAVCTGSSINLSDIIEGGVWTASNTNVSVASSGLLSANMPGKDTIFYTVADNCGTRLTTKIISIDSTPHAGFITSATSVCAGASIIVTDTASGGTWTTTNGIAAISVAGALTGISPGVDTVLYSVTNACGTATAIQQITIDPCNEGINNISSVPAITIFPNPASSVATLRWSALQPGSYKVSITDVAGRQVFVADFACTGAGGTKQLNLAPLQDGIYFVSLNSDSFHFIDKLVVAK